MKFATYLAICSVAFWCACGTGNSNPQKTYTTTNTPQAVAITISGPSATMITGGTQQFTASVSNTTNTAVVWEVNGIMGGNPSVGTITSSGLYTAPTVVPNGTVTVTAISQADSTKVATFTLTIQAHYSAQSLSGQYVFTLIGSDGTLPLRESGIFTADGSGNITNGIEDRLTQGTVSANLPLTGSYTLTAAGTGILTLVTSMESTRLAFALNSDSKQAQFVEDDTSAAAAGMFYKQDPAALTSMFSGNFVFSIFGYETGLGAERIVGKLTADGKSNITGVEDAHALNTYLPLIQFTGDYIIDSNGRGTASFNLGPRGANYFFYIVDSDHALILSADATFPSIGTLYRQQTNSGTLSGTYVFSDAGQNVNDPICRMGLFTADGVSSISGGIYDSVQGSTANNAVVFTGTFTLGGDGRGIAQLADANGSSSIVFYLVDSTRGVTLYQNSDRVEGGILRHQQLGTYSNSSFFGSYAFGATSNSITPQYWWSIAGEIMSSGDGNITLAAEVNDTRRVASFTANATYQMASNGRGTGVIPNAAPLVVFYVVSPSEIYLQEQDSSQVQGVLWKQD